MRRATVFVITSLLLGALPVAVGAENQGDGDSAAEGATVEPKADAMLGLSPGLIAIGAALAVGLGGLATGLAQSKIGAAGCGALASNEKLSGFVFLLVALPETIVLFGFVVAFLLLGRIPQP